MAVELPAGAEPDGPEVAERNAAADGDGNGAAGAELCGVDSDVERAAGERAASECRRRCSPSVGNCCGRAAGDRRGARRVLCGTVNLSPGGRDPSEPDDEEKHENEERRDES